MIRVHPVAKSTNKEISGLHVISVMFGTVEAALGYLQALKFCKSKTCPFRWMKRTHKPFRNGSVTSAVKKKMRRLEDDTLRIENVLKYKP